MHTATRWRLDDARTRGVDLSAIFESEPPMQVSVVVGVHTVKLRRSYCDRHTVMWQNTTTGLSVRRSTSADGHHTYAAEDAGLRMAGSDKEDIDSAVFSLYEKADVWLTGTLSRTSTVFVTGDW